MRFSTILLAVSTIVSGVVAVTPGNDALRAGLSPKLEEAIKDEFGPVAFDAFASNGCNFLSCGLTIAGALPCLVGCVAAKNPLCIPGCINLNKLCSCINCLPDAVTKFLHNNGICTDAFKAEIFGKTYLGIANETEAKLAQEFGYSQAIFEEL